MCSHRALDFDTDTTLLAECGATFGVVGPRCLQHHIDIIVGVHADCIDLALDEYVCYISFFVGGAYSNH